MANSIRGDGMVDVAVGGALSGDGSANLPLAVKVDGATITINGSNELVASGGGGGTPAGANAQIQFNNSGSFGASNNLQYTAAYTSVYGQYAFITTNLGTANSNLLFTSRIVGPQANTLTIAYVDPGAGDHAFSIAVNIPSVGVGTITVSLATTSGLVTTTAQDVIDAFTTADTFPSLLPVNVVAVASGGNATGVVGAGSWTLTGGVDGTALTASGVDISGPGTVIGPLGIPINVHFVNPGGPTGQQVLLWGGSYDGSGIVFGEATDVGVDFVLGNPGGGYQQVIGADLTHSFLQGASALTGSGGDGAPAILRPGAQDGAGVPGKLIFDFTGGDAMVATGPLVVRLLDGDHAALTTTGFTNGILTNLDVTLGSVTVTDVLVGATSIVPLTGTTGSIGGSLLATIGATVTGTATVTGAVVGQPVAVSASDGTLPNGLVVLSASVTSANTVTVQLSALAAVTPTAKMYNVAVLP